MTPGRRPQAGRPDPARDRACSGSGLRISDNERTAVLHCLRDAYATGRLSEAEFQRRMDTALCAPDRSELGTLLADLPTAWVRDSPPGAALPRPGRLAAAIRTVLRRGGRWRVPRRFTAIAYAGAILLDLRAAEFMGSTITITAVACKSRISIIVPPGARVIAHGLGVTTAAVPGGEALPLPEDALIIRVRGYPIAGTVEAVHRMPPGDEHLSWGMR